MKVVVTICLLATKVGYRASAQGMDSIWSKAKTKEAVKLQFMMEYGDLPFEWEFKEV